MPACIHQEIGHFNVFRLEPYIGNAAKPVPYKRSDYFKITLMVGEGRIHYTDQTVEIKKQALVFSNPQIPYRWEHTESIQSGFFCVFTPDYFRRYVDLHQYEVFQTHGTHVFDLSDEQVNLMAGIFELMLEEINSNYLYKYDILRMLVFEVLHFALKM